MRIYKIIDMQTYSAEKNKKLKKIAAPLLYYQLRRPKLSNLEIVFINLIVEYIMGILIISFL